VVNADGAVVSTEPVAPNAERPDAGEPVHDPWIEEPVPGFEVHDPPEAGRPPGRKLYVDDGDKGIDVASLVESAGLTDSDPLDALLQVAWNLPARTRSERVRQVREQHAAELAAQTAGARAVLEGLLARYEEFGVADLETTEVFRLAPLGDLGSPVDLARVFGGGDVLRAQLERVQSWLYAA
jgi:type I restriction enzyme R subunit